MTWIAMIIGTFMIVDGLFTLTNKAFVEEQVQSQLPFNINLQAIAIGELILGLGVLLTGGYAQVSN